MKSFASIIVACLAVIALSAIVSAGGDHGGKGHHKGKGGHMRMWKKMMTCNGVNATTDSMKTMFETCKKGNTPEENGSGEKGEGGHGKKHHMWKKIHECVAKEAGVLNDDGSYKMEGIKKVLKDVYGDENGAKLGDALEKNCSDQMTKKSEDKKEKMQMMKCVMKNFKEVCHVEEKKEEDEDM